MALSASFCYALLRDINNAISVVEAEADRNKMDAPQLKYVDGKYVIHDLLLAKAQVYNAIATIESGRKK